MSCAHHAPAGVCSGHGQCVSVLSLVLAAAATSNHSRTGAWGGGSGTGSGTGSGPGSGSGSGNGATGLSLGSGSDGMRGGGGGGRLVGGAAFFEGTTGGTGTSTGTGTGTGGDDAMLYPQYADLYTCQCDAGWSSTNAGWVWGNNDCALPDAGIRYLNLCALIVTCIVFWPCAYHLFVTRLYRQRQRVWTYPTRLFAAYTFANGFSIALAVGLVTNPARWVVGRHVHATLCFMMFQCVMGLLTMDMGHHFAAFWLRHHLAPSAGTTGYPPPAAGATVVAMTTPLPPVRNVFAATADTKEHHVIALAAAAAAADPPLRSSGPATPGTVVAWCDTLVSKVDASLIPPAIHWAALAFPVLDLLVPLVAFHGTGVTSSLHAVTLPDGVTHLVWSDDALHAAAAASLWCWGLAYGFATAVLLFALRRVDLALSAEARASAYLRADPLFSSLANAVARFRASVLYGVVPVAFTILLFGAWPYLRTVAALLIPVSLFACAPATFFFLNLFARSGTYRVAPPPPPPLPLPAPTSHHPPFAHGHGHHGSGHTVR